MCVCVCFFFLRIINLSHVIRMSTFSVSVVCPGSPSLPDKAKHNREVMMLLPSHRERTSNSMYYNMGENGQVGHVLLMRVFY